MVLGNRAGHGDFLATPNAHILAAAYGNTFLDLLTQESYLTENLELRQVLTGNPHADATRLCGNLAESLVVKYCNTYPEVNRTLARYARFGERELRLLDNYIALGTASKVTQRDYRQHYQPNDTQRDIIWINRLEKSLQLACVGSTGTSSKPAGLQVKASNDGMRYVFPEISNYFYPILYFDLCDDWQLVKNALDARGAGATLIHPDEIMKEIKFHLKSYFSMIIEIINGGLTIRQLIGHAMDSGDSVLLASLVASDLAADRTIIIEK